MPTMNDVQGLCALALNIIHCWFHCARSSDFGVESGDAIAPLIDSHSFTSMHHGLAYNQGSN
jgi:hypothetical protein